MLSEMLFFLSFFNLTTVYHKKTIIEIFDRIRSDIILDWSYEYLAKNCSPFFNLIVTFVSKEEVDKTSN
jgi:hypothetical protein